MNIHFPCLQFFQVLHHHIMMVLYEVNDLSGIDKLDVQEAIDYAERELTEHQKASLQIYVKNKQSIDQVLEQISAGLTELQVGEENDHHMMDYIIKRTMQMEWEMKLKSKIV